MSQLRRDKGLVNPFGKHQALYFYETSLGNLDTYMEHTVPYNNHPMGLLGILSLPDREYHHFTDPGGMEVLDRLGGKSN